MGNGCTTAACALACTGLQGAAVLLDFMHYDGYRNDLVGVNALEQGATQRRFTWLSSC